jgi:hypothetical protein
MTHSPWIEGLIFGTAVVSVGLSIGLCVKFFLWPGETGANHVKRRVLR